MRLLAGWVLLAGCGDDGQTGPAQQADTSGTAATAEPDDGVDDDGDGTAADSTGQGPPPSGTDDSEDTTGGLESSSGDTTGTPGCAPRPDPDAPWITDYQADVLAKLTGQAEALPGVTLGVRSSLAARMATGDYLLAELAALGLDATEHSYSASGRNVYATLPATDGSQQLYVIGAHFDTVPASPGANDNATGVALVLSVARYLTEVECRSAGVMFVLLDEEEIGLVGSYNFAAFLEDEAYDIVAVHTIDQMGWDSDGDRAIELERADAGLFELYDAAEQGLPDVVPLTPTNTGFTDHVAFRESGFAAVGLTEEFVSGDTTRHYHLSSDALPTVDTAYLRSTTVLVHEVFGSLVDP